jgi:hypothetical protein
VSFLEKIGLKSNQDSKSIPPPPPKPGQKDVAPKPDVAPPPDDLPPLGKSDKSTSEIRDLPSRAKESPIDSVINQSSDTSKKPSFNKEGLAAPPELAPAHKPTPLSLSQQPPIRQSSSPKQEPSHEEVRAAFSDVPPIKGSDMKVDADITNEDVQGFEVDDFVLPEGEDDAFTATQASPFSETKPLPKISPKEDKPSKTKEVAMSSLPKKDASEELPIPSVVRPKSADDPLFIDIATYEDIQQRIKDLKRQVGAAGSHIDTILSSREREDEEFSVFIKELEKIQDDLITIDEDLFEEK